MASAQVEHDPLDQEDIISLEQVATWTTDALKDYCERHGLKKSGARQELVARVYYLYNARVPELPSAKQQAIMRKNDYISLYKIGIPTNDPLKIKSWKNEKEGMREWPKITYVDIEHFMRKKGCVGFTSEGLTAYKTGKAYSYYSCNWLQEIYYTGLSKHHKCCYLKADCLPSNRINNPPHELWIKCMKDGDIISAFCTCVAGFSQTCNHVAVLLFKLEAAFRFGLTDPACTSKECEWNTPSNIKKSGMLNIPLNEMVFQKPSYEKGKTRLSAPKSINQTKVWGARKIKLTEESDSTAYTAFITDLKASIPDASLFLPSNRTKMTNTQQSEELNYPIDLFEKFDISTIVTKAANIEHFTKLLKIAKPDIALIEENTRGQSKNELWMRLRKCRITASNFYRVFTKIESICKSPTTDCTSLVNYLISPPSLSHLPQISKGIRDEKKAIEAVLTSLKQNHTKVVYQECGLFIHSDKPYIGASPDGIIRCECCENRLLEIKCPSLRYESLKYLSEAGELKENTNYYGQVQGQMVVTGIQSTYFCIYYEDQLKVQVIQYDAGFCEKLLKNLDMFFHQYLLPSLLRQPVVKRLKY